MTWTGILVIGANDGHGGAVGKLGLSPVEYQADRTAITKLQEEESRGNAAGIGRTRIYVDKVYRPSK